MTEAKACPYAVELEHITKVFGNFKANDDVTARLEIKGTIPTLRFS